MSDAEKEYREARLRMQWKEGKERAKAKRQAMKAEYIKNEDPETKIKLETSDDGS